MSKETLEWLNNNVLVGFTEQRGNAWHYKASAQGDEPNHYPGAIPVADVLRRLFHWRPVRMPIFVNKPVPYMRPDGEMESVPEMVELVDRIAIGRDDTYDVFGIFKDGYADHAYDEWLLGNVSNILRTGEIEVGSAGQLRNGAQAFVSVEVPNTMTTPEGVAFRPNLLACTSLDGSLATTYKRVVTVVVCDNTLDAGLSESGQVYKVKHSKHSKLRLEDAASALEIVYDTADDFTAEIQKLCQWEVSTEQFDAVLDVLVPMPTVSDIGLAAKVGVAASKSVKRAVTVAGAKREQLRHLYTADERAATWTGTAFGVLQAFNTWEHHYKATRGTTERTERNMSEVLSGRMGTSDAEVLSTLALVAAS